MNKKKIMIAAAVIVAAVAGILLWLYSGTLSGGKDAGVTDTEDGAEIEIEDDADSFACSCGCSDGNEMEECQCQMCEENESMEEFEQYYYKDPETGEMVEVPVQTSLEPMNQAAVEKLTDRIAACSTFCIRRCESEVVDSGTDDPDFTAISESRYYYDAANNQVYNADGEDITSGLKFSVEGCKDAFDFLKQYFAYQGISTDFITDDLSHKKDLLLGQRVYSFGLDECEEIDYLEEKMDGVDITERDCSYQVKTYEDGVDRIMYVTVTVAGTDSDGVTIVRYVTYILDYDPTLPEKEAIS